MFGDDKKRSPSQSHQDSGQRSRRVGGLDRLRRASRAMMKSAVEETGIFVCVKGAQTKACAVKLGSRPNFRKDYAGFPNPIPPRSNPGINHRNTKIYLIFK